ncbi:Zn-dependent protease with chaperone function [Sinorhizobium terangae]|uniref:M48 family metalloprotease n=1 Tax=Sinorhizobium terangae TaxID=110322 RepID=A0A6N7LAQ0_SINTE|nr:M48 family metallopeptidase [Sinorhizobium terangae]MBB4184056.1 Zn-dependent protease with chaperone function [Sinorhizobium terangae]MQX14927.1 M48 family metalloprotease [Sinorhizobium terangae]
MASDNPIIALGEWHPAGSSRSVPSRLAEAGERLTVHDDAGAELSNGKLSAVEISPRVGAVPRRITFPDGSLFETSDNAAIDRFLTRKGRGREGIIHRMERFHPRLIAFVAAAILLGTLIYRLALPALVEVAVAVTPPVVPRIMSSSTLEALDRTVLGDSELDEARRGRILEGFRAIAAFSGRGKEDFTLNFRKGGAIGPNAFALPDGTLILTDELVELAGNDTEMIVGVLAHEIGHVELKHSLRQIYRAAGVAALIMLIAGDIGSGAEDVLVQGGGLLSLSYSRSAEAAADRHSVELMSKAGRDPTAIARFFQLIEMKLEDHSETSLFSTHPGTPERRKAILDLAAELRAQP